MKLLESKVAIVTGGSRGIGKAICQSFAENGCDIALTYNNSKESAENLADDLNKMGVKAKAYKSDASSFDDSSKLVDDVMSDFGKIDVLVNNAGTNLPEPFLKVKKSSLETLLEINTKSAFNVAKLCTDKMLKLRNRKKIGGSIIHTSSMFGLVGGPNRTVYSMTKFGIEGLTKGMAVDLAKYNIRVNSVCPTFVATPRAKKYLANKKFNKYALDNIPLGRIATESDVATAITFLSSNAASMITGTNIIIDGGWTAK